MDNSKNFQLMLNKAMESEPLAFKDFDRTKNVQDQLQEMMINHFNETVFEGGNDRVVRVTIHDQLKGFTDQIYQKDDPPVFPTNIFDSQEQLWLAFVMKEKYGKVWKRGMERIF